MADLEQAFAIDLKFKLFYQHPPSLLFKGCIDKSVIALQSLCAGLPHRGDGIITLLLPISAVFIFFKARSDQNCLCYNDGCCWACRDWPAPPASPSLHNANMG